MRTMVSTYGEGDEDKVLNAMRMLAYDKLVLVGEADFSDSLGFRKIRTLEEMSGHEIEPTTVGSARSSFMDMVEEVSEVLAGNAGRTANSSVILNISGGSKLLGDAALFAAFRLGVEAYHCEASSFVKLPVIRGATAKDMFTEGQSQLIACLSGGPRWMDEAMSLVRPASRQALERIVRELRRADIVHAQLDEGKVLLNLTAQGKEVAKAILAAGGR